MNFSGLSNRSLPGKLARLPLRLIPPGVVVPILQGPLRGKKWIVGSSTHGCWLGSYEYEKQKAFSEAVKPGDVVYDIGANVGFYTLLASVLVGPSGRVVAFEPLPRNLRYLRKHLGLNGCGNVMVMPVAVSDCAGRAGFDPGDDPSGGALCDHGAIEVETVALDRLARSKIIPGPDVIKVDVEGGESRALAGGVAMLAREKPLLFLSIHDREAGDLCQGLLDEIGYEMESLNGLPVGRSDEILARPRVPRC
jgi:FkbM family methyltransferase